MNILIVLEDFSVGGAQIFAVRLANALSLSSKVFIYNCYPTIFDGKISKLISSRVTLVHYNSKVLLFVFWIMEKMFRPFSGFRSSFINWFEIHNLSKLKKLAKRYNIEIINSHMFYADVFGCKLKFLVPELKHFISMHGCYENKFSNPHHPIKTLGFSTLSNCDGIIIAAEKNRFILDELNLIKKVLVEKIYYGMPDGGNTTTLKQINEHLTFGIVSRPIKAKGWEELILAFISLKLVYPKIRLILVGAGSFQHKLQRKYGHDSAIRFVGHSSNPRNYIRTMDVCVLPTYFKGESLPNSVIEYLSEAKPVIATNIGEINQMLDAKGHLAGTLIDLVNNMVTVEQLKSAMEQYIVNPDLLSEHSKLAQCAFKKFDIDTCVSSYVNLFKNG